VKLADLGLFLPSARAAPRKSERTESRAATQIARASRSAARHGFHVTVSPFDRLNVDGVQNEAALRYQT